MQQQTEVQVLVQDLTMSEKSRVLQENTLECLELVDEILKDVTDYNFLIIHQIYHYMKQIPKFGVLGQDSNKISETMYNTFKDAYEWSNKANSSSQIVTTYTRDHIFAMKDLTIKTWNWVREEDELTKSI